MRVSTEQQFIAWVKSEEGGANGRPTEAVLSWTALLELMDCVITRSEDYGDAATRLSDFVKYIIRELNVLPAANGPTLLFAGNFYGVKLFIRAPGGAKFESVKFESIEEVRDAIDA